MFFFLNIYIYLFIYLFLNPFFLLVHRLAVRISLPFYILSTSCYLLIQVYVQLSDQALLNGLSLWTCCYLIQNIWHFPVDKNMRSRLDLAASQPINPMVPKWWIHMAFKLNAKWRNYPYQRNRHSYTVVWTNYTS